MDALLVVLVGVLGLCRADSDLKCDNTTLHEVPDCRFPCPPERTCQNFRAPEPPCVAPMQPCTPQCVCADGYARNNYGGTCVTFAQCDKCPGNNQYFSCDGAYSENCTGSCHCNTGYERDANNVCVSTTPTPPPVDTHPSPPPPPSPPVEEPQPVTSEPQILTCNVTEHQIAACTYGCPPERTCQNRNWPPLPCAAPGFPCTERCICDEGYARNQDGGTCVTLEQCDQCGENEYFQCDGEYDENCVGRCHCFSGYTRDNDDKCVYENPASTPKDDGPSTPEPDLKCDFTNLHKVSNCIYPCPPERTCQNFRDPQPRCQPSTPWVCTPTCVCAGGSGYTRNRIGGTCVTFAQCDMCPASANTSHATARTPKTATAAATAPSYTSETPTTSAFQPLLPRVRASITLPLHLSNRILSIVSIPHHQYGLFHQWKPLSPWSLLK